MPLEKIDQNKDKIIVQQELKKALDEWFFDLYAEAIWTQLQTYDTQLLTSFAEQITLIEKSSEWQKIKDWLEKNPFINNTIDEIVQQKQNELQNKYINTMVSQEENEVHFATLVQKIQKQKDEIITGKTWLITIAKELKNEEALSEVIPYFLSTLTAKEYSSYLAMLKPEWATILWIANWIKKDKNQNRQKSFLQQYIGTHIDTIADLYPWTKKELWPYVKKTQQYDTIIAKVGREWLFLQQDFVQIVKENHLRWADIKLIAQIFQHVQQKEVIMNDLHAAMNNHNSKFSTQKSWNTQNPYGIKDYSIWSDNLSVARSEANLIKSWYWSRRCQKVDEINDLYIQALKTIPINKRTIKPMQDGTRNAEIPFTGQLINIQALWKNEKTAVILVDTFPEQIELWVANFWKAWWEKKRSVVGQQVGSLVWWTLAVGASTILTEWTSLTQSALIFAAWSKVWWIMWTYSWWLVEWQSLLQAYETTKKANFAMDASGNIDWLKVWADSAFDFTSAFLTFGIAQKIPWLNTLFASSSANIFKQMGTKSLQFGFEELAIESLLIDMPMNAVQTSTYAFTWLSEGWAIVWQSALGSKTEQRNNEWTWSLKGDLWWSLQAGMEALEQNLKTENLAQVVTSTIAYWWLLEAGRAWVWKLQSHISVPWQQKLNTLYGEYQQWVQQLTTHLASLWMTLQKQWDNLLLVDKNGSQIDPIQYENIGIWNYITQLATIWKRYVEQMRDIQQQLAQNPDASRLSQMIRKYQVTWVLYSMESSFAKKLSYVNKQLENPNLSEQEKNSLIIMKWELSKVNDILQDKNTSFYIEKSIKLPSGFQIDVQTITKSGLEWRNTIDQLPALTEWDKVVEIHINENANIKQWLEEVKQQLLVLWKDVKYVIWMSYLTSLWKRYWFDIIHDKKLLERSSLKNWVLEPFNECFKNFILYKQLKERCNTIKEQMRNNWRNKNPLFLEFKEYVRNNWSMQDNDWNQINESSDKFLEMWLKYDIEDIWLMIAETSVLINNLSNTYFPLEWSKTSKLSAENVKLEISPTDMSLNDFISMDSQLQWKYLSKHFNNDVELNLNQFTEQYSKFVDSLIKKYPPNQQVALREEYGLEKNKNRYNFSQEIQNKNSLNSDKLIDENWFINSEAKVHIEQFMRNNKALGENETLTEAQVRKIYEVHSMTGENEIVLNVKKWKSLREIWFTQDQVRVLMEGKVCGIDSDKKSYVDLKQLWFTESEITKSMKKFYRDFIIPLLDSNMYLNKEDIIEIQSIPKDNIKRYITLYKKYDLWNKLNKMFSFYLKYVDESFEQKLLNYISIKDTFDKVNDWWRPRLGDIYRTKIDDHTIEKFNILCDFLIKKELKITRAELKQLSDIDIEVLKTYIKKWDNNDYLKYKWIDSIYMLLGKWEFINKTMLDLDNTWFSPREKTVYKEYGYTPKEMIAYETIKVSHIIDKLEQTIHQYHFTWQSIELAKLLTTVKSDMMELSLSNRIKIIEQISEACKKIAQIKQHLDFEKWPYKSAKDLLIAMRGITDPDVLKAIDCDISAEQYGVSIVFYVSDPNVYNIIYNRWLWNDSNSWGFSHWWSAIPELYNTLTVCNWSKWSSKHIEETKIHEDRHTLYNYLETDYKNDFEIDSFLRRAQDEIIAQWKWWEPISYVKSVMINWYDYIKQQFKSDWWWVLSDTWSLSPDQQQEYDRLQSLYQPKLQEALGYLEKFYILWLTYPNINFSKERIMNILSTTPIQKRGKIYDIYSWLLEIWNNKIEDWKKFTRLQILKTKFIEILQNIKDKSAVKKLFDIYNNVIFLVTKQIHQYTINGDDYYEKYVNSAQLDVNIIEKNNLAWWSHTNTIEHITNALSGITSLDGIIKILLDPQYSHIQYGEYEKISARQIVAMIPQIQQWILPIESIPIELRSYIIKFMK